MSKNVDTNNNVIPRHVAIVMDGNGRWATKRGLPRLSGHKVGGDRVQEIVRASPELGIEYLTLFAFSTENWKRSKAEVSGLMTLFKRYMRKQAASLLENGVRIRFIGDRSRFDKDIQNLMDGLEETTKDNTRLHLTIAVNYGGRDELTRAAKKLAVMVVNGELSVEDITENTISGLLDTKDIPDPDLIIRTSGELRISGFLPWQSAYSEFVFPETLWPDFDKEEFEKIIQSFGTRERRFGAAVG